jgi:hypothetical protein
VAGEGLALVCSFACHARLRSAARSLYHVAQVQLREVTGNVAEKPWGK